MLTRDIRPRGSHSAGAPAAILILLAGLLLFRAGPAAEPDYLRFDSLPGNPQLGVDVGCVRIRGNGLPLATETFRALGFTTGPNGIPENGGGDDVPLGPMSATYTWKLERHHARYEVTDPAQVGKIDPATGVFTAGPGPITGLGLVTAIGPGGKKAEAPIFILPPDFVSDPPPRAHHLTCRESGEQVRLEWLPGGAYLRQIIMRGGVQVAVLPGDATHFDDGAAPPGIHEYEVAGVARDPDTDREVESDPTPCVVVFSRPRTVHLLWGPPEQVIGVTNSTAALREALEANGEEVFQVEGIFGVQLQDFRSVWAAFGTYPQEHFLWLSEAVQLAEYLTRHRGRLYIEGADIWGFVPLNAFLRVDGVFDCPPEDINCPPIDGGRNDLANLRGANGGNGLDLSSFAGPVRYTGENWFIDRLVPAAGAGAVWFNADVGYAAGIAYRGPGYQMIECSFEFGGIQADRNEIARRYLEFLGASTAGVSFVRGDVDLNGQRDLTDAIAVLNSLFLGTPVPDCDDARDVNDDGALDITDGIRLLGFLFLGDPAPPEPFPVCGTDPTLDAWSCLAGPAGCP